MSDLVIIGHEQNGLAQAKRDANTPSYIKPGTGGKTVRYPDGRTVGPIGGELLRIALSKGAYVISEEPVETFQKRTDNWGRQIE
jgi:hypothetical protein